MNAITAPSLAEAFREHFPIGAAVSPRALADPARRALLLRHFNSITAENTMKPMWILDREATLKNVDPYRAAVNFAVADRMLDFARENGLRVRFHTLCWHNQTPGWFFSEDWSGAPDAAPASRETMLARQAAYIADVMEHVNGAYPGLVYTWDVLNEAVEPDHGRADCLRTKSPWFRTCGDAFIAAAFREAKKHRAPGQTLIYNDFGTFVPVKQEALLRLLRGLREEGLVDGFGMQAHLSLDRFEPALIESAARAYAALGLTLQVTEMDIHCRENTDEAQKALADAYAAYFAMLLSMQRDGADLSGVTFWGLTDADSWLTGFRREPSYPLLFTAGCEPKPAFDAVLNTVRQIT